MGVHGCAWVCMAWVCMGVMGVQASPEACGWYPTISRTDLVEFLVRDCVEARTFKGALVY